MVQMSKFTLGDDWIPKKYGQWLKFQIPANKFETISACKNIITLSSLHPLPTTSPPQSPSLYSPTPSPPPLPLNPIIPTPSPPQSHHPHPLSRMQMLRLMFLCYWTFPTWEGVAYRRGRWSYQKGKPLTISRSSKVRHSLLCGKHCLVLGAPASNGHMTLHDPLQFSWMRGWWCSWSPWGLTWRAARRLSSIRTTKVGQWVCIVTFPTMCCHCAWP